jgi:hypothetical protein
MPLDIQGMLLDPAVQNQIRNQIFAYEINYMIEQTPIFSRLNHQPAGSSSFTLDNWAYRPYTYTLGAAITTNSQLTLTLTDVSPLMQGDLLSFGNDSETVMVVSDPKQDRRGEFNRAGFQADREFLRRDAERWNADQ